jgi:probable rRNA maturation factor
MNVEYLEHDTLTDVITFPYGEEPLSGDIFISIDRVADNASGLGVPMLHELHRVMVHGVLHLMGHDDATPEAKATMCTLEDEALATLPPSLQDEPKA